MIENPMTIDSHWSHLEREPRVYGECAGCQEDIIGGNDYYEIPMSNGESHMIHQNQECCHLYVGEIAWCRTAGE